MDGCVCTCERACVGPVQLEAGTDGSQLANTASLQGLSRPGSKEVKCKLSQIFSSSLPVVSMETEEVRSEVISERRGSVSGVHTSTRTEE